MVGLYVNSLRKIDHIQKEIRNEKVALFYYLLISNLLIGMSDFCIRHIIERKLVNRKHGARDRLCAV